MHPVGHLKFEKGKLIFAQTLNVLKVCKPVFYFLW